MSNKRVSWSPQLEQFSLQKVAKKYHDDLFYKSQDYDLFELEAIKDEMEDFLSSNEEENCTSVINRWKVPDHETTESNYGAPAIPRRQILVQKRIVNCSDTPSLPTRRVSLSNETENRYVSPERSSFGCMGQVSTGKTPERTCDAPILPLRRVSDTNEIEINFKSKQFGLEKKEDSHYAPDAPTLPRRRVSDANEIETKHLCIKQVGLESQYNSCSTDSPALPIRRESDADDVANKQLSAEEFNFKLEAYISVAPGSNSNLSDLTTFSNRSEIVLDTILETEDNFSVKQPNQRVSIEIPENTFQFVLSIPEKASAFRDIAPRVARRRSSISIEEERYTDSDASSVGSLSLSGNSEKLVSSHLTNHVSSLVEIGPPISFTGRAA